jgi:hypothetical protein
MRLYLPVLAMPVWSPATDLQANERSSVMQHLLGQLLRVQRVQHG